MRLRIFALQTNLSGQDVFVEMVTQADTLWLLPNVDCGILVYRATCPIANIEASDIKCVYSVMEDLKSQPRDINYYLQNFLAQSTLAQNSKEAAPTRAQELEKNVSDETLNTNVKLVNQDTSAVKMTNEPVVSDDLKDIINDEDMILELIKNAEQGIISDNPNMNENFKQLLTKVNEIIAQFKLTTDGAKEFMEDRKKAGLPVYPTEEEVIENFREVWEKDPQMEADLRKKLDAQKMLRQQMLERIRHNIQAK
jgi:hypothetical protein